VGGLERLDRVVAAHRQLERLAAVAQVVGDAQLGAIVAEGRTRLGRELDIDQVLLITLRDGRWQEILALPTDPDAFAEFWA